jgi:hypothetical protein
MTAFPFYLPSLPSLVAMCFSSGDDFTHKKCYDKLPNGSMILHFCAQYVNILSDIAVDTIKRLSSVFIVYSLCCSVNQDSDVSYSVLTPTGAHLHFSFLSGNVNVLHAHFIYESIGTASGLQCFWTGFFKTHANAMPRHAQRRNTRGLLSSTDRGAEVVRVYYGISVSMNYLVLVVAIRGMRIVV